MPVKLNRKAPKPPSPISNPRDRLADLLGQLRSTITAGTSALFLLASQAALDTIGADDSICGSDALVTTLGDEHEQILRHVFGADDAYPDWTE